MSRSRSRSRGPGDGSATCATQTHMEDRNTKVQELGWGQEAPGVKLLGTGVCTLRVDPDARALIHADVYLKSSKQDIMQRRVKIGDNIQGRKALLGTTARYCVPEGTNADKSCVLRSFTVESGDTRGVQETKRAGLFGSGTFTSWQLGQSLALELSKASSTTEGTAYITCRILVETYRIFMDPELTSCPKAVKKNFLEALRSSHSRGVDLPASFQQAFGDSYVKAVFVGGELTILMHVHHGPSSRDSGGGVRAKGGAKGGTLKVGVDANSEQGGHISHCEIQSRGGMELPVSLTDTDMETVLRLIESWKESVLDFQNMQPTRVHLSGFEDFYYLEVEEQEA